jgi:hypothetical protein
MAPRIIRAWRKQNMRRGRKFLIFHFMFFGVLGLIAVIPGGTLFLALITAMVLPLFGMPAFLAIAAPTVLLYSVALMPLWLALTEAQRRIAPIAGAAVLPILVAVGPGMLSRQEAADFALRMSKDDMNRPANVQPKSIELIGDGTSGIFVYEQTVGDKNAACNEICRRLLFNGETDWVRMTRTPDVGTRSGKTFSATYRIERRASCPQAYPDGTQIERAVRDRLINGDCLIVEADRHDDPDATLTLTTRYFNQSYPPKLPEQAPREATIVTVKELGIATGQGPTLAPVLQQTETVALTLALPFYVGSQMNMQGGYNGATIGRDQIEAKPIDTMQALRNAFGYKIAEISAPTPEDEDKVAERILALPPETIRTLSAQQQDAIKDVLTGIRRQPSLSDANVEFIRRVIADKRITEGQVGIPVQDMFRKFTPRLEPLIPVVIDRISTAVPQQTGHYQSMLGWSLTNYSADSLRPYRDAMVAVAETQADWPSGGVLTRLAELGSDEGVNLVIRRLDSRQLQQFAAIAACRASDEAWPVLEPAVLAHLAAPRQSKNLQDDEGPLMLALVRHGKKSLVADMIERRDLFNKSNALDRLTRFEPGFAPEKCRDGL